MAPKVRRNGSHSDLRGADSRPTLSYAQRKAKAKVKPKKEEESSDLSNISDDDEKNGGSSSKKAKGGGQRQEPASAKVRTRSSIRLYIL